MSVTSSYSPLRVTTLSRYNYRSSCTHRDDLVASQTDDVSVEMDLHVSDVGDDIVVMAILCLHIYPEVRHAGIVLDRGGHVVFAVALEVNHVGVEGTDVRVARRVADCHLCKRAERT